MMGRNHLVAGAGSLGLLASGVTLLSQQSATEPVGALAPFANDIVGAFSAYQGLPVPVVVSIGVAAFAVGSLLPDIDNERSMLGRHMHLPIGHRTWTHTVWTVMLFAIAGFALPWLWWLALGVFLHLFWDSFSREGVCWFYPISRYLEYPGGARVKRNHRLKLYRTSSMAENVIAWAVLLLGIGACAWVFVL